MADTDEDSGLEALHLTECIRLLEAHEFGRLAVSNEDGPRMYPIRTGRPTPSPVGA